MHPTRNRVFFQVSFRTLTMRQIEALADVGDHLRALLHHHDETAEKQPEIHITLKNAATPTQLQALLMSPSRSGAR